MNSIMKLFSSKQIVEDDESRISMHGVDSEATADVPTRSLASQIRGMFRKSGDFEDSVGPETPNTDTVLSIPVLGVRTATQHQRVLGSLLGASLLVLAGVTLYALNQTDKTAQQLGATGQALMQSQRLAKSVGQALIGSPQAFPEVTESADIMSKSVHGLKEGGGTLNLHALDETYAPALSKILPLADRADKSAKAVLGQQKVLTQIGDSLRTINRQSSALLESSEILSTMKLQQNGSSYEVAAAGELVMLSQRISKSANEFLTADGVSPEAIFFLGKDLNTFKEILAAFLDGNPDMRIAATKDPALRDKIAAMQKLYDETRTQATGILTSMPGLVAAREAQASIIADNVELRKGLEDLQGNLSGKTGISFVTLAGLLLSSLLALVSAGAISYVQLQESRKRQILAEEQRVAAELEEQVAKRTNDANQAAILRLMNELQAVSEGDLTHQATVSEDITGAIADSVNYTVGELRSLVANVQTTASLVATTTSGVDQQSTELLSASNNQLAKIRETGSSVVNMASRINGVSNSAQESASVARQSLKAAEVGLEAVQNTIGGMNSIREQIQETSKRIKRLGESSQEIGEITELISDITEQTNVLALNAAIQAASAGEAGRGFSVVAEEVQRLAERSADATRQISALVKAIQTDTQDAIGAMERSTQGVVEGAKLSDNAGAALSEIERVSRQVAELIENISAEASKEANLASGVANDIQDIFAVTEQTGQGTHATAEKVRELSSMAEELRQSVSRFKIA